MSYGPSANYIVYSPTLLKGFIDGKNSLSDAQIATNIEDFSVTDDQIKQLYSNFNTQYQSSNATM